jgi:hypothetical protein
LDSRAWLHDLAGLFWAWRCFLSEFRRVMFALAVCTASVLVGCLFAAFLRAGTFFASNPAMGIAGSIWVAAVSSCVTGCITIGMSGILFAMADNAFGDHSFEVSSAAVLQLRGYRRPETPPGGLTGSLVSKRLLMSNEWLLSGAMRRQHISI